VWHDGHWIIGKLNSARFRPARGTAVGLAAAGVVHALGAVVAIYACVMCRHGAAMPIFDCWRQRFCTCARVAETVAAVVEFNSATCTAWKKSLSPKQPVAGVASGK